ncbi:MAG TPA: hypothetical protein VFK42_11965 [Acidimicrobiales bacterium]|jgi:hypothetical protein|nr:hypothetical protein [Acidimicrobiales bacterium]
MRVEIHGIVDNRPETVVWDDGAVDAAPHVLNLVHLAADIDELDLDDARDGPRAVMAVMDRIGRFKVA